MIERKRVPVVKLARQPLRLRQPVRFIDQRGVQIESRQFPPLVRQLCSRRKPPYVVSNAAADVHDLQLAFETAPAEGFNHRSQQFRYTRPVIKLLSQPLTFPMGP